MKVELNPIVNYTGTLTHLHGLWHVTDNYGSRLELRDAQGNKLHCHPTSVTIVEIPRFTEARALALHNLRHSETGRITSRWLRQWLLDNGFIEAGAKRGTYQLTDLGWIATEALTPWLNYEIND